MKPSIFNFFVEYKNFMIGYNTLYESVVLINNNLFRLVDENLKTRKIDKIKKTHPQLYKILTDKKFIIANNINEISTVKKTLDSENNNDSILEITINPTINCNFRCWYCYENHSDKSHIDISVIKDIINYIKNSIYELNKIKKIKIEWFGGEPLLYFNEVIVPIMSELNTITKTHKIEFVSGMTTNGYLLSEKKIEYLKNHNHKTFQITIDGNKDKHNKIRFTKKNKDSYSTIVSNIITCLNKKMYVTARINITSNTKLNIPELLQDFICLSDENRKFLCFSIHKVWQEQNSLDDEIEHFVNQIQNYGFKCASFYSNPNTIRKTCYADKKNHFVVNPSGKLFKCTARDFCNSNIEGYLLKGGIIEWNDKHRKRELSTVLNNKECLSCFIMPICNAGCSQKRLENTEQICLYGGNETLKLDYAKRVLFNKIKQNSNLPSN